MGKSHQKRTAWMKQKAYALAALCFALLSAWSSSGEAGRPLFVPGTGACETALRGVAAAFNTQHRDGEIDVPSSTGSGGGIRSVLNDQAVLARSARPLNEKETGQGLSYTVFARDTVAFAVAANVSASNLTTTQIVDIFNGKTRDWEQVGGSEGAIRVLVREPDDSGLAVIKEHIKAFQGIEFPLHSKSVYHEYEMVEMLTKYRNAIGWIAGSSASAAGDSIKLLAIDDVSPSPENVLRGRYRLVTDFAFVYKRSGLTDLARKFIDFVFSDSGRAKLKEYGLIPVDRG